MDFKAFALFYSVIILCFQKETIGYSQMLKSFGETLKKKNKEAFL